MMPSSLTRQFLDLKGISDKYHQFDQVRAQDLYRAIRWERQPARGRLSYRVIVFKGLLPHIKLSINFSIPLPKNIVTEVSSS